MKHFSVVSRLAASILLASTLTAADQGWVRAEVPPSDRAADRMMFVDDENGWLCGFFQGVFKTSDGGRSWVRLDSNLKTTRIASVWFVTRTEGWAVGTSYGEDRPRQVIIATHDGGGSWVLRKVIDGGTVALADVWFATPDRGWVVGSRDGRGLILETKDSGRSWVVQYEGTASDHFTRVRFWGSEAGWVVGTYAILGTVNGGRTWRLQYREPKAVALSDIAVLSQDEAWVVGGWATLLRTEDGGASWTQVDPPEAPGTFLWSVVFADRTHGWACGANGVVISTTDGGKTWRRESFPATDMLVAIAVMPSRVLIASGSSEVFWRRR